MIIFSFNHLLVDFGLIMVEKRSATIFIEKNNKNKSWKNKEIHKKFQKQ